MRKTTSNTPRRVIIAILAAAMSFSTVAAGVTPLCAPAVAYAGVINSEDGVTINSEPNVILNTGNNVTNNGNIDNNQGDVNENNGTIVTNNGNVDNNSSTGTIGTNEGTVTNNFGTVGTNNDTVTNNFGTVTNNTGTGTVLNNFGTATVGGKSAENQWHPVSIQSTDGLNTNFSAFNEQQGVTYLSETGAEGYVNLVPATGYTMTGAVTNDWVTLGSLFSYKLMNSSGNNGGYLLMIRHPSGTVSLSLSNLGIQLIQNGSDPTTPTTPTSSESTGSSSNNDSTSESVSNSSGESGLPAGWTPASDTIYRLIEAAHKRAVDQGSSVVMADLGDNPSFDENAARSIIDKAGSNGSDCIFTVDGKAYNLIIPGGITPEQREALMRLLAQEPGGTAGPMRLVQLLNQVGVNASVKELTGGELFNRIMGVTGSQMNTESQVSAPGSYLYKLYYKLDGYDYSTTNYRVVIQDPDPKTYEKYSQIMSGESVTGPTAGVQGPLTATQPAINPAITGNGEPVTEPTAGVTGNENFAEKTSNEKATSKHVVTLKLTDSQPAINPAITGNGEPVTGSTAGVQETTVSQTIAEAPNGTLSGWTPEAERIYTLVDTAQKQSIQNGNSVAQVDLGDKPNFDEKATRSFIDKLNTSGADLKFTADGKAYNINVPAGTTVEQREALINLLKQEPNGEAGPARLAQLMQQVGIKASVSERTGRDLVAEFTNNGNFAEKTPAANYNLALQRTFDVDDGKTTSKATSKATSKHVVTLKVTDSQPAINVVVQKNTTEAPIPDSLKAQAAGPVSAGDPSTRFNDSSNQTTMEVQTGTLPGWTPEAEKIYNLMDAGRKQAINSGSNVVSVEFGDKPNFNENAARSLIDKAASGGSDSVFTADGKAYNLVVPGGVTVEQREALMKLLAQEPGGAAGPIRLAQLLNQVGVNASVKELNGGDLFNRMMGVTDTTPASSTTAKVLDESPVAKGSYLYKLYYKLDGKDYSRANYRVIIQDPDPKASEKYGAILNGDSVTGPTAGAQGPLMTTQPAINPAITGNGEPVTGSTAGVQETTVSQTIAEAPNGTAFGWTPEAERIYTLVDTAQKQSIQNGNSVAQVDLGDKPNFDEKATRSFVDKLNTSGADLKFTADGKAYNINVPAGTTVEQREALINLLKQEPNGEAGPLRIAQLMQQVGINITFTERSGRDLVNEFTGNALGEKTFKYEETSDRSTTDDIVKTTDDIVKVVLKESNIAVQATKSVKAGITLKSSISAGSR